MGSGAVGITKNGYELPWDDRVEILKGIVEETEAGDFIDEYGDSLGDFGGHWDFEDDFIALSRAYLDILFTVYWEQYEGHEEDAVYYFMNGLWYMADTVKIYPPFRPEKLK